MLVWMKKRIGELVRRREDEDGSDSGLQEALQEVLRREF